MSLTKHAFPILLITLCSTAEATDFRFSTGLRHFDRTEYSISGAALNREHGVLAGIGLAMQHTISRITHTASIDLWHGTVEYTGGTQGGAPLLTETDQLISSISYRISTTTEVDQLSLFLAGSWHSWHRDISPTSSSLRLDERYRWLTLEPGLRITHHLDDDLSSLVFGAGILISRNGRLKVNLASLNLGEQVVDLGDGEGLHLTGSYIRKLSAEERLILTLEYEQLERDQGKPKLLSNGTTLTTLTEPESRSTPVTLNIAYSISY